MGLFKREICSQQSHRFSLYIKCSFSLSLPNPQKNPIFSLSLSFSLITMSLGNNVILSFLSFYIQKPTKPCVQLHTHIVRVCTYVYFLSSVLKNGHTVCISIFIIIIIYEWRSQKPKPSIPTAQSWGVGW